jgi:transketolase
MRTAFIKTLCELAASDERVMLLTADLGWSVLEPFARSFPDRYINVGVAEQNLLGIATGLAVEGHVPFVYSIATFASMRGYEQFRNGAVLHRLPVRVVGVGGGFAYGHAGPTHHALEDLSIARTQPGVTVLAPADQAQARSVLLSTAALPGPAYLRIDKNDHPDLPGLDGRFALDTPELIRPGRDLLFLTTGSITREVLRAAESLERRGASAAVAVLAHLGYSPGAPLRRFLRDYSTTITVEEGSTAGGLGSLTAEAIAQEGLRCRLHIQGVTELFTGTTGGVDFMRRQHGLDAPALMALAQNLVPRRMAA